MGQVVRLNRFFVCGGGEMGCACNLFSFILTDKCYSVFHHSLLSYDGEYLLAGTNILVAK